MSEELVKVRFKIKKDADGFPETRDWEDLNCVQNGSVCEVRSIPFYLRDVAYGDKVRVRNEEDGNLEVDSFQSRGGYSVFRLWLRDEKENRLKVVKELVDLGLLVEWDGRLIALAVPPTRNLDEVISYIMAGKASGRWGAQDGFVFEPK